MLISSHLSTTVCKNTQRKYTRTSTVYCSHSVDLQFLVFHQLSLTGSLWCSSDLSSRPPPPVIWSTAYSVWAYFLVLGQSAVNKQETQQEKCGHEIRTAGQLRWVKPEPNWCILGGLLGGKFGCVSVTRFPRPDTHLHSSMKTLSSMCRKPPTKTLYPETNRL